MPEGFAPTEEHAFRGLGRQAELLASGEASAVELLDLSLARIDATAETLNAFRVVRPDAARAEAEEADRRLAAGERLPLLGVPIAIKDDMDLEGETTPFGCEGAFEPARADGEVARRLRAAGAVIVGKTNTPEVGQWPFTEGPAFGVTRNPWSLEHSPAGSSGGSAAAVAAGLVPAAVGSDGAGSVRIPAAWTHLVGVKPQRGRISTWPDPEAFRGLTVIGPLARTVGDAALLLDVLSGNVAGDLHRPPAPAETFAQAAVRDPGKLRIALSFRIPFSGSPARLDPEVREAVERLAGVLEDMGHSVDRADPSYGLDMGASFMPRSMPGVAEWVRRHPDRSRLDPRTRHNVLVGRLLSPLHGPARPTRGSCAAASAGSSAASTSSCRRPPLSRRCRSEPARGSPTGRPTEGSSPPVPTHGRGTCSAGRASTSPPGASPATSRWARNCSDPPTASRACSRSPPSSRRGSAGTSTCRPTGRSRTVFGAHSWCALRDRQLTLSAQKVTPRRPSSGRCRRRIAHIGATTTVLEAAATSIGAGILMGGFLMGTVGLVLGWTREDFEGRVLRDGYIGGVTATAFLIFDLLVRYAV